MPGSSSGTTGHPHTLFSYVSPLLSLTPHPQLTHTTDPCPRRLLLLLLLFSLRSSARFVHAHLRLFANRLSRPGSIRSVAPGRARDVFYLGGAGDVAVFGVRGTLVCEGGGGGWQDGEEGNRGCGEGDGGCCWKHDKYD
jgi:hypothetical protein